MGRQYITAALSTITSRKSAIAEDVELKPMTAGAWAAWARDWSEPATAPATRGTSSVALSASTLQPTASKA